MPLLTMPLGTGLALSLPLPLTLTLTLPLTRRDALFHASGHGCFQAQAAELAAHGLVRYLVITPPQQSWRHTGWSTPLGYPYLLTLTPLPPPLPLPLPLSRSTPHGDFWCCQGTGIEAFARL